jgi:hypothetical protein
MISMDQSSPFPFSFRDNFGNGQWAVICDGSATMIDSGSLTLSQWTHFAAIRNASGSELYRDGIRVATGSAGTISASANLLLFGTDFQPGAGRHLNGLIDDIRIYSRRLSANEIRILASRRGIAYEMATRRRSSSAVQYNRRRRLLLGAT